MDVHVSIARSSGVGECIVSDSDSDNDSDSDSDVGVTCGDEIDCDAWEEEERVREEANERKLLQRYPQLTPYTEGLPDDLLRVKSDIVAIDSGKATSLRKQWYDKGFSRDQNKYNRLHLYGPFVRQSDQELIRTTVASW
ncbi:hypothetical protein SARC_07585 [Sphaeroforma arctica JP610]|uniref:Uncharacterized protein n=1 Tax=Sphaeroforma arctica JP610 TaxID=667725 RepID=A0A0L0FTL9_9EUKA|nr:hypothetical protein SARC_07585 [Sphaeroforma arctica JP610]KNC80039.1 hypothetical protein SARC_07585 [Sphaeroforma arctica JP610]|eukprot:XP_014153941.1 hypothetical protein SARC_07585 [Sphaeroforma arctica JP610]